MPDVALGPTPTADIQTLLEDYRAGRRTPTEVVTAVADTLDRRGADGVWISIVDRARLLARAAELESLPAGSDRLPLYGVPFAVKDSLHVRGMSTTLACPDYATVAGETAAVVQLLLDAGAVLVGKTNLDQFATGLNGTRTPYGPPLRSVYGDHLVSGGSSSGSALAVATGQVPFAVATDTAGSGRVPAALNGILGFKPSRGLLSTRGLVPACRSLDCVSLMATTVADLERVFDVIAAPDEADPWTRRRAPGRTGALRIGLPDPAELVFGSRTHGTDDPGLRAAHERACAELPAVGSIRPVPLAPFLAAGDLLYAGPWVAERTAEFGDFLAEHPDAVLPVVAGIIAGGARWSAVDAFRATYRLAELRAEVTRLFDDVDVVVLPTLATTPSPAQVHAEPIATNTDLGLYTHCGNLLDLCAVVVPAGTTDDGRPVSLMVLGPALADDTVLAVARRLTGGRAPATGHRTRKGRRSSSPATTSAAVRATVSSPTAVVGWSPRRRPARATGCSGWTPTPARSPPCSPRPAAAPPSRSSCGRSPPPSCPACWPGCPTSWSWAGSSSPTAAPRPAWSAHPTSPPAAAAGRSATSPHPAGGAPTWPPRPPHRPPPLQEPR